VFAGVARRVPIKAVIALLSVVVIIVGAVVVYPTIGLGLTAGRPTLETSVFTSSHSAATGSSSSSSVSSASSASSNPSFNFAITSSPDTILIAPGANLTYASVDIIPVTSAASTGSEMITLKVVVPSGIHLSFVSNPVKFSPDTLSLLSPTEPVQFAVAADKGLAPGDYKITAVGTSGSVSANSSFTVRVTPYLVIAKDGVFSPANLTVKAGSTVFWINLGNPSGGDNAQEFDVSFKALDVHSAVLVGAPHFDSFSHTFVAPGTYDYYCAQADDCNYPYMNGEIIVTG
jgi:plastocyanin